MHVSPRTRTILQSILFAAVGFGAVYLLATSLQSDDGEQAVSGTDSALSVEDAIRSPSLQDVAVRGYLFVDEQEEVTICSARTDGDVAFCAGTVMQVVGLDLSRLALERGETPSGRPWAWSDGPVSLLGSKRGALLDVKDILPEEER